MTADNLISLLVFLLAGGGGGDLVECIPVDTYWHVKDVQPDADALLAELDSSDAPDISGAIEDLGAPDAAVRDAAAGKILAARMPVLPQLRAAATEAVDVETERRLNLLIAQVIVDAKPRQVRRLMAIRTLGLQKEQKALAPLRRLATSKEPFVADYARKAIARIEGAPLPKSPDRAKEMAADLQLLPAECVVVGQARGFPALAPPIEKALRKMELNDRQQQRQLEGATNTLIDAAERLGNIRVDGITLGVSKDFSDKTGFLVVIARGEYDPEMAAIAARQERMPMSATDGGDLYQWGPEAAFFFASSERLILMGASDAQSRPTEAMAKALQDGKGTLHQAKEIMALAEDVDRSQPLWLVGQPPAGLRDWPLLGSIDSFTITGSMDESADRVMVAARASGQDANELKASVEAADQLLRGVTQAFGKFVDGMPPLQPLVKAMQDLSLKAEDATITATTAFEGSITALYLFSLYPYTTPIVLDE